MLPSRNSKASMDLLNLFCRKQKKEYFTRADCNESDLVQYSCDHLKAAEVLYNSSGRFEWRYLHSASFLSNLSIELLLKACLLHYEGKFPKIHDFKKLFKPLRKRGFNLSKQNQQWFKYLNYFNSLRYPDPTKGTEVDINQWEKTEALFTELRKIAPKQIQILINTHYRYSSNVKSGNPIWP